MKWLCTNNQRPLFNEIGCQQRFLITLFDRIWSSDKGKQKFEDDVRPRSPFDGCGISYKPPSKLLEQYSKCISKGLLKTHDNKKPKDYKYLAKSTSFGFEDMDFHIDIVFYYLRKKSKLCSPNQYIFTTINCLFNIISMMHTQGTTATLLMII
ncbi:hypothetical protein H5410_061496 [Solanum commersonii]|uniref:Uncharacterized protein n=1 Tax=Solanum commersonii TaxID=4109 RepID=A0A9J5W867_SOLCO|nr:hypothetical protein H5410_061496 [Solanum commersonii]